MTINVQRRGWIQVVQVSGDDPLRDRIENLIDDGENLIVVDLTRKRDLDSLALGQLVACREHARRHDAVIKLILTPSQGNLVVTTRLDQLFETFGDEDAALDSFNSRDTTIGIP